jgi:hypothetical protein
MMQRRQFKRLIGALSGPAPATPTVNTSAWKREIEALRRELNAEVLAHEETKAAQNRNGSKLQEGFEHACTERDEARARVTELETELDAVAADRREIKAALQAEKTRSAKLESECDLVLARNHDLETSLNAQTNAIGMLAEANMKVATLEAELSGFRRAVFDEPEGTAIDARVAEAAAVAIIDRELTVEELHAAIQAKPGPMKVPGSSHIIAGAIAQMEATKAFLRGEDISDGAPLDMTGASRLAQLIGPQAVALQDQGCNPDEIAEELNTALGRNDRVTTRQVSQVLIEMKRLKRGAV